MDDKEKNKVETEPEVLKTDTPLTVKLDNEEIVRTNI